MSKGKRERESGIEVRKRECGGQTVRQTEKHTERDR